MIKNIIFKSNLCGIHLPVDDQNEGFFKKFAYLNARPSGKVFRFF